MRTPEQVQADCKKGRHTRDGISACMKCGAPRTNLSPALDQIQPDPDPRDARIAELERALARLNYRHDPGLCGISVADLNALREDRDRLQAEVEDRIEQNKRIFDRLTTTRAQLAQAREALKRVHIDAKGPGCTHEESCYLCEALRKVAEAAERWSDSPNEEMDAHADLALRDALAELTRVRNGG